MRGLRGTKRLGAAPKHSLGGCDFTRRRGKCGKKKTSREHGMFRDCKGHFEEKRY